MITLLLTLVLAQDKLPSDAQQIITKADAKIEATKKAYEDTCVKIKAQEAKDLQRIYDAIKKGDPTAAAAIKEKLDVLTASVAVAAKGASTIDTWIQGKWVLKAKGYSAMWEFKDKTVSGGSNTGKYSIDGGNIQIVWDNGVVESIKIPEQLGDEAKGTGAAGQLTLTRVKPD